MSGKGIRTLALLLLLILVALPLASCAGDGETPPADSQTGQATGTGTGATPPAENQPDRLQILSGGSTEYVIVRSWYASDWEQRMAVLFQDTIRALTGITIPITEDYEDAETGEIRAAKEIVIGTTNREDTYTPDYEGVGDGYHVFVSNERLVFASKSEGGLYLGIRKFFENFYAVDIETDKLEQLDFTDLSVPATYLSKQAFPSGEIPYMNALLDDYVIAYAAGDYMQGRMAYAVSLALKNATGLELDRVGTDAPAANSIVLRGTGADGSQMSNGRWELSVSGQTIAIAAGDYYGFTAAAGYLRSAYVNGHYPFTDGFSSRGSYIDTLGELNSSNAYAYQHTGDVRIMFYNTLWQNRTGQTSYDDVPAAERNRLQAEMIAQYMPDVLGLQEVDGSKRDKTGEYDIATLLKALGYAETLDPAVENLIGYNCTPLFYNTATTRLVDSEYYWYSVQSGTAANNDKSSKSLTWGVFEQIATGDRYLVVSTHMCTQDADIRLQQAQEAMELIDALVARYGCPAFIGGDFNASIDSSSCQLFLDNGYINAREEADVTTSLSSVKGYPAYSEELGMMRPNSTGVPEKELASLDHLLMTNGEAVTLTVFGVVADECTCAASDHLPIFVDAVFTADPMAGAEWSERY